MPSAILAGVAVLGHVDVGRSGRCRRSGPGRPPASTWRADAERLGHPPGRLQLEAVPLAVIDRQGVERESLVPGDGGGRGRIEPPGKEDHRRLRLPSHVLDQACEMRGRLSPLCLAKSFSIMPQLLLVTQTKGARK